MTLIDEFSDVLRDEPGLTPGDASVIIENIKMVSDEFQESSRWTEHWIAVFQRNDEYVALSYEIPASEYQEGSEGDSEVYEVEPVKVTITRYEKKVDY